MAELQSRNEAFRVQAQQQAGQQRMAAETHATTTESSKHTTTMIESMVDFMKVVMEKLEKK